MVLSSIWTLTVPRSKIPILLMRSRSTFFVLTIALGLGATCWSRATSHAQNQNPLNERGYQDREILYELQAPDTHAFRITHDYTVRKVGEKYYFNVVRRQSRHEP